jgi:hypothetical protein
MLLLLPRTIVAEPFVVDVILPTENRELRKLVTEIDRSAEYDIKVYIENPPPPEERGAFLLIISDHLLPLLSESSYRFSFALYVSEYHYDDTQTANSSAVFNNQPLSRQLALANAIVGKKPQRLGLAYVNPKFEKSIENDIEKYPDLHFIFKKIDDENPVRSLNHLIQDSDILLSTGEPELYNAQTIRSILLSSYRHNTLVIGPNEGFVNAGAFASVISHPQDYAQEIRLLIEQTIDSDTVQAPRYPSVFTVKVNRHVAASMGIDLPSEAELKKALGDQ